MTPQNLYYLGGVNQTPHITHTKVFVLLAMRT